MGVNGYCQRGRDRLGGARTGQRAAQEPIAFPLHNAYYGDIDLIGGQKPQSRARDVAWGQSLLEVAVQRPLHDGQVKRISPSGWSDELPSWTWAEAEGQPMAVHVRTTCDRLTVQLNGASIASRKLKAGDKGRVDLAVPINPSCSSSWRFITSAKLDGTGWRGRAPRETWP